MRAAARSTALSATNSSTGDFSGLAIRLAIAFVLALMLLLMWSPAVVHAQGSATRQTPPATIVVEKASGETLHDIAVRILKDSTRWRAIATANGLPATDSRLVVKTGTRLRMPSSTTPSTAGRTPNAPAGSLAAQTAGKGNADSAAAAAARRTSPKNPPARTTTASNRPRATGTVRQGASTTPKTPVPTRDSAARVANETAAARAAVDERPIERYGQRIGLSSLSDMRAARGKDEPTVFVGPVGQTEAEVRRAVEATQQSRNVIAPRHGEYAAAPFPIEVSRLAIAGKVVRRMNGASSVDRDLPRNISVAEEAVVALPSGVSASVGQRYVAIQKGPVLANGVHVAIPTGVLEVVRADPGQPLLARVMRQSGIIEEGQPLVAFEGAAVAPLRPTPVANDGVTGTVRFIAGEQLLPSLQSYLVLSATQSQGVQPGDEFWLVERFGTGADAREQRIAVARIVRTSPHGSTAVVTHQDRPGIAVGVAVRRVARAATGAGD